MWVVGIFNQFLTEHVIIQRLLQQPRRRLSIRFGHPRRTERWTQCSQFSALHRYPTNQTIIRRMFNLRKRTQVKGLLKLRNLNVTWLLSVTYEIALPDGNITVRAILFFNITAYIHLAIGRTHRDPRRPCIRRDCWFKPLSFARPTLHESLSR